MVTSTDISSHNELILKFISEFKKTQTPIEVSFKDIVKNIKTNDRFTHNIHSYPAKLLVHIPYFFLNNTFFSKVGDTVLDPFNGSGTVALESILADRIFYGADANPLANLITKVKLSDLDVLVLQKELKNIIEISKLRDNYITPEVRNLDFWFPQKTIKFLSILYTSINEIDNGRVKDFFLLSFSNMIKKVSYCDTRISVPVKLNPDRYNNSEQREKVVNKIKGIEDALINEKFASICLDNIKKIEDLQSTKCDFNKLKYLSNDARFLKISEDKAMPENSVNLIITSPPYAGAQKYIRASSLNLGWTNLANLSELSVLERTNIGREVFRKSDLILEESGIEDVDNIIAKINETNKERAFIAYKYIQEMKSAIDEMYRVLQKGGHLVMIIGNNKITGIEFNTQSYLTQYLISKGMTLEFKLIDDIKSYGLMTKRNKTADIISREYVLVLKK